MTRIFIEDLELDLDAGLSNQITYSVDDLNNLDSKTTSFSKTIVIPGTTNNNKLLGNIFEFNNSNLTDDAAPNIKYNFNASRSAKCRIEVNGLQVIKGVFRLMEIIYNRSQVEYECAVFGELGGFFSKLGTARLEDIDFSAYNEVWSGANITASWNNCNSGTGLVYPLIDYGAVSTGAYGTAKKDYQYKALRPALHVREYLDKIITNAGYTWSSTFFGTDFFKRLIIPHNAKNLTTISSTALNVSYSGAGQQLTDPDTLLEVSQPTHTALGSFTTANDKKYTYGGASRLDGVVRVRITGNIYYIQNDPGNFNCGLTLQTSTGGVYKNQSYFFEDTGLSTIPFDITLDVSTYFQSGDFLQLIAFGNATGAIPDTYTIDILTCTTTLTTQSSSPVELNLGETILVNDTIPRGILQKDFFASILKMFYLMVTEDKAIDKHLVIEPWASFYNTTPSSYEDWSDKIDRDKQIRMKPMSEINSRYYELNYRQDNDYYNELYKKKYNEGYGNRIFDNGFDFARDKETVEVIFSGTPLVGYVGEDKVVSTIFKKTNDVEERIDSVIRIMQCKKITGVASWKIMDSASTVVTGTDYGYAGHLDDPDAPDADICFGVPKELYFTLATGNLSNNLFNAYYSGYMAEITDKDSRLLQCMIKLNEVDIFNLDFATFKFIDGGLYRLAKLIDYSPGTNDLTKAEFLRTIYTTY